MTTNFRNVATEETKHLNNAHSHYASSLDQIYTNATIKITMMTKVMISPARNLEIIYETFGNVVPLNIQAQKESRNRRHGNST